MLQCFHQSVFSASSELFVSTRHSPYITIKLCFLFYYFLESLFFLLFVQPQGQVALASSNHYFARLCGTSSCFDFQPIMQLDWNCILPYLLHIVERFCAAAAASMMSGASQWRYLITPQLNAAPSTIYFTSLIPAVSVFSAAADRSSGPGRQSGGDLFPSAVTKCVTLLSIYLFLHRAEFTVSRRASPSSPAEREEMAGPAPLI